MSRLFRHGKIRNTEKEFPGVTDKCTYLIKWSSFGNNNTEFPLPGSILNSEKKIIKSFDYRLSKPWEKRWPSD